MDFSVIIPKMREAVRDYVSRKASQGQILTERDAIVTWLDRYYDSWIENQLGLIKSAEGSVDPSDRRRARRIPIEVSAYYRVLWLPSQERENPESSTPIAQVGEIKNISAGGLYIVTGRAYPISTLMEIQFELPPIPESISAFAMVCWREERGMGRHGHGLHFSHIEASQIDEIQEALMEKLLDAPVVVLQQKK